MKVRRKTPTLDAYAWFKNGDHPQDACELIRVRTDMGATSFLGEGKVVRYYRRPEEDGELICAECDIRMHEHGWIDGNACGRNVVCPGDYIVGDGTRYCAVSPHEMTRDYELVG
jgi:hypothetical protein